MQKRYIALLYPLQCCQILFLAFITYEGNDHIHSYNSVYMCNTHAMIINQDLHHLLIYKLKDIIHAIKCGCMKTLFWCILPKKSIISHSTSFNMQTTVKKQEQFQNIILLFDNYLMSGSLIYILHTFQETLESRIIDIPLGHLYL